MHPEVFPFPGHQGIPLPWHKHQLAYVALLQSLDVAESVFALGSGALMLRGFAYVVGFGAYPLLLASSLVIGTISRRLSCMICGGG